MLNITTISHNYYNNISGQFSGPPQKVASEIADTLFKYWTVEQFGLPRNTTGAFIASCVLSHYNGYEDYSEASMAYNGMTIELGSLLSNPEFKETILKKIQEHKKLPANDKEIEQAISKIFAEIDKGLDGKPYPNAEKVKTAIRNSNGKILAGFPVGCEFLINAIGMNAKVCELYALSDKEKLPTTVRREFYPELKDKQTFESRIKYDMINRLEFVDQIYGWAEVNRNSHPIKIKRKENSMNLSEGNEESTASTNKIINSMKISSASRGYFQRDLWKKSAYV